MTYDPTGPFVVWQNYGYDGWQPRSFQTLREAVLADRHGTEFVVTRIVEFEISATETPTTDDRPTGKPEGTPT
jgi:hypothetical protein